MDNCYNNCPSRIGQKNISIFCASGSSRQKSLMSTQASRIQRTANTQAISKKLNLKFGISDEKYAVSGDGRSQALEICASK
jgi:hypothetical protein